MTLTDSEAYDGADSSVSNSVDAGHIAGGISGDIESQRAGTAKHCDPPDTITVLKSTTGMASKYIITQSNGDVIVRGFNAGTWFYAYEVPVSDIISLSLKLAAIETLQNCFLIRGAARQDLDLNEPQRRQKVNFETPTGGRRWVLIDFDKLPLPAGLSLHDDVQAVCEYLVGLLPDEFHRASYHWQLSSSAGITEASLVSLHIWFWLNRPIPDAQLKTWSKAWNASNAERVNGKAIIDPRLFNDVPAHYTAAPTYEGMSDPFEKRSGLVRKAFDEVALKLLYPKQSGQVERPNRSIGQSEGFRHYLAQIGDHQGGEGFHQPIIRAVASYAATYGRDGTDIEALYGIVRERVLTADRSAHDDYYVERAASREHIIPAIEQALSKFGNPGDPRRKSRQVSGLAPHFSRGASSTAEASALLKRTIDDFFGRVR